MEQMTNSKRAQRAAKRKISRFIAARRTAASWRFSAVTLGIMSVVLLLFGTVMYGQVFGGGSDGTQPDVVLRIVFLVFGLLFGLLTYVQIRNLAAYRRRMKYSLSGLQTRGLLEQAAEELDAESGNTVFGEKYFLWRFRTVMTEHFLIGRGLASAASFDDILWYYYQPSANVFGKLMGCLVAYSRDSKLPFVFFLGAEAPDNAARQVMQRVAERNPSAVYGAENRDKYLALLEAPAEK